MWKEYAKSVIAASVELLSAFGEHVEYNQCYQEYD